MKFSRKSLKNSRNRVILRIIAKILETVEKKVSHTSITDEIVVCSLVLLFSLKISNIIISFLHRVLYTFDCKHKLDRDSKRVWLLHKEHACRLKPNKSIRVVKLFRMRWWAVFESCSRVKWVLLNFLFGRCLVCFGVRWTRVRRWGNLKIKKIVFTNNKQWSF